MAEEHRPRLGRGLAALIGDAGDDTALVQRIRAPAGGQRKVPTAFLHASGRNPRRHFAEDDLGELTQSVKEKGVLQPILVRTSPKERDHFEIIAGERRWRAAQRAGLHDVPIVVIEADDRDALEIAIIENVQRADLDPIEEANGYQQLISEFNYAQDDLAKVIGKSRSHVANTLRLLTASDKIQGLLRDGKLTAGHARAVMTSPNAEELAAKVADLQLSVRAAEELAQQERGNVARRPRKPADSKDADTRVLEKSLSEALGLDVVISHRGDRGGKLEIAYKTLEQLDHLCRRLQSPRT